jgi:hypothetical protein
MMLYHAYLRRGIVYVPAVAQRETGAYTDIDPVAVVPVTDVQTLARAFLGAIARGNIIVPRPKGKYPPPVLLKYAGVKTWSAFARGTSIWSIEEEHGKYQIVGYRTHAKGYWVEDPEQIVKFPAETTVKSVIDRMIAILQDAASQQ